jgi:hypothetical protein
MSKHCFVTYGDIRYQQAKQRLVSEAHQFGFDHVCAYGRVDLPKSFVNKTSPWINHKKGGGYWIWKPYILKNAFEKLNDGDILIYLDAGCQLNKAGKKRYEEYIALAKANTGSLGFVLTGKPEVAYCNDAVFSHFNINKYADLQENNQIAATCLVFIKNDFTATLIEEFYQMALNYPQLFSNSLNKITTRPDFIGHRHDQAIFSILRKLRGSALIPDETWAEDFTTINDKPFWARRIKDKKNLLTRIRQVIGIRWPNVFERQNKAYYHCH